MEELLFKTATPPGGRPVPGVTYPRGEIPKSTYLSGFTATTIEAGDIPGSIPANTRKTTAGSVSLPQTGPEPHKIHDPVVIRDPEGDIAPAPLYTVSERDRSTAPPDHGEPHGQGARGRTTASGASYPAPPAAGDVEPSAGTHQGQAVVRRPRPGVESVHIAAVALLRTTATVKRHRRALEWAASSDEDPDRSPIPGGPRAVQPIHADPIGAGGSDGMAALRRKLEDTFNSSAAHQSKEARCA